MRMMPTTEEAIALPLEATRLPTVLFNEQFSPAGYGSARVKGHSKNDVGFLPGPYGSLDRADQVR